MKTLSYCFHRFLRLLTNCPILLTKVIVFQWQTIICDCIGCYEH